MAEIIGTPVYVIESRTQLLSDCIHNIIYLLQAMADIFRTPVYVIDVPNSAALGGCYRAKLGN